MKKCNLRTLEQAGTNICSMGYQNSNFKIGPSLFGCAEKYTEHIVQCDIEKYGFDSLQVEQNRCDLS